MRFYVLAFLFLTAFASYPWTNCGKSSDHIKVTDLEVSPSTIHVGDTVTVSMTGSIDETVTSGTVKIEVKLDGVRVKTETEDICKLDPQEYPCPISSGPYTMTKSAEIPSSAPHGKYELIITAIDQNSDELICAELKVDVEKK